MKIHLTLEEVLDSCRLHLESEWQVALKYDGNNGDDFIYSLHGQPATTEAPQSVDTEYFYSEADDEDDE